MHVYASHTLILSQPGWSASRPSPFAIKSQTNVWAAWPRCCRDGLRFGERVPDALLISRKRNRHSTCSFVTHHQQLPSHTITTNITAFSTTPARHITSTPLLISTSYLMLVNFLSLCSVSSTRSGTRHWTSLCLSSAKRFVFMVTCNESLRRLRRMDSREYGVLTEGQPEAGRIAVTIRLPNLSPHRLHVLCRLGWAIDIWCCSIACFIL